MTRDDVTDAADDELDAILSGQSVSASDDFDASMEQETPTAGGDDVEYGVTSDHIHPAPDADLEPIASCRFCELEFKSEIAERRHHCHGRDAENLTSTDLRELIDPMIHECKIKYLFCPDDDVLRADQDPAAPFFAIAGNWHKFLATNDDGSDDVGVFDAVGETWRINHEKANKWESAIATKPGDSGAVYHEFNLGIVVADDTDDVQEKKVNCQFRVARPDLRHHETGDQIQSLPADLPNGIRVMIDSSNVEPDDARDVLRVAMSRAGIDHRYFRDEYIHEWSRVINFALYARVLRDLSEDKIVSRNGLLERLARFSSVRRGRGELKWDNEEIIGHRNAAALNPTSLDKLYQSHDVGKLLKCYHMKNPKKKATSDPTTHPKLEVQYSTEYSPADMESVPFFDRDGYDLDDLRSELDEFLMFSLNAAGLSLSDDGPYVADEYWSADTSARNIEIHTDRTDDLRQAEEDMTVYQLARDDVTSSERAVLRALADGGRPMHRDELADGSGTSTSTVQRAFDTFGSLIERIERGTYALADEIVADKVDELMSGLEDVSEWVEQGISSLVEKENEIAEDSALATWARNHRALLRETRHGLEIELYGTRSKLEIQRILRAGLDAAQATGSKTAAEFVDSQVSFSLPGEERRKQRVFSRVGSGLKILGSGDYDLI